MKNILILILLNVLFSINIKGQEVGKIESFNSKDISFRLKTAIEKYYLVQSSKDLKTWQVVAHFLGDGKYTSFKDYRKQFGESSFYRLVTKPAPFKDGLYEREWKLVAMHEPDKSIFPKSGRIHSIEFGRDGRVGGRNDCNRYFGKCSIEKGNWLNFNTPFGSTLMFCMSGSLDFKFFEALKLAKGYEVEGMKLRIYYGKEVNSTMEFEAG